MDRKSKVLLIVLGLLIIWSVWATYDRVIIKRDYLISLQLPCDTVIESCFVSEFEDEETGQMITDYYKIIEKPAYALPACQPADAECLSAVTCAPEEPNCQIIYCDPAEASEDAPCAEQL